MGFYNHPIPVKRKESWDLPRRLQAVSVSPWVFMGDFNEILDQHEKWVLRLEQWRIEAFCLCLEDCGLSDLRFSRHKFTWCNNRVHPAIVREKLDRASGEKRWVLLFPNSQRSLRKGGSAERGVTGGVLLQKGFSLWIIFTSTTPTLRVVNECLTCLTPKVSAAVNVDLIRPYTADEVQQTLNQMHPLKSPGPESFWSRNQLQKSAVVFSKNTPEEHREVLGKFLGSPVVDQHVKYLVLPAVLGRSKREVFDGLKDRTWRKMQTWSARRLSQARRGVDKVARATYAVSCSSRGTLTSSSRALAWSFIWGTRSGVYDVILCMEVLSRGSSFSFQPEERGVFVDSSCILCGLDEGVYSHVARLLLCTPVLGAGSHSHSHYRT
ncbi:UNVERIFIED_CONTAM: hypothetical protein Sradi_0712500 [Sesamum radiatum]|uniref:Endonuclease/exonuclease/phosphatase n=1 Tax=Sesamum radiatum TaxID=300843 RepID=A0AAW2VQ16_SESRA